MFEEGYSSITNIDISNVCIKAMKEKYKDKGDNFKYLLMDVKAMDFPEASFDAVLDKATLDSVLVTYLLFSVEKIQLLMPTK